MAQYLSLEKEAAFPNLRRGEYEVTSVHNARYNCIAHAADRNDMPWWPPVEGPVEGVYWPPGVPPEETVEAFVIAYKTAGRYTVETTVSNLEAGYEKVAIFADSNGTPTHAAKQLPCGAWTSKLGDWEDIRHDTLQAMEDDARNRGLGYGKVAKILRREQTIQERQNHE